MRTEELKDLLEKQQRGILTSEEAERLEAWDTLFEKSTGITESLSDNERKVLQQRMWSNIAAGIETPVVDMKRGNIRKLWRIAAAAVVLFILGTGAYLTFFKNKPTEQVADTKPTLQNDVPAPATNRAMVTLANGKQVYLDNAADGELATQGNIKLVKLANGSIAYENANGEITTTMQYNTLSNPRGSRVINMTLADGSKVWLNAGSSLTYPVAFIGNERKVSITGEAYFEVAHDASKPFKVGKGDMQVTVLGTHFNVNAYDDETDIKVTLLEGSVQVNNSGRSSVVIKPGQQAIVNGDVRILSGADVEQVMAWKNGRFVFGDKADIQTIMRQIARWYDVDVEYKGSVTSYFGGSISRDANVSEVFKVLEATGNVKCKLEGRKVFITSN